MTRISKFVRRATRSWLKDNSDANTLLVSDIDARTSGSTESRSARAWEVVKAAHEITGRLRRAQ